MLTFVLLSGVSKMRKAVSIFPNETFFRTSLTVDVTFITKVIDKEVKKTIVVVKSHFNIANKIYYFNLCSEFKLTFYFRLSIELEN